jgi:hypothetical protein
MPFPCHAVPLGFRVRLSHLIYTARPCLRLAMPRPCPAPSMPFFARPRYIAAVERRPVGDLPAIGFFRLPRGVPRKLLSVAYHSQMQVARRSVKLPDWQLGYFRLPCGLSRRTRHCRSRAGARHGMCELTNGMGAACYV